MASRAKDGFSQIEAWLNRKTKEDLKKLVLGLVRKYENAADDLKMRITCEDKNTVCLMELIQAEADELASLNENWKYIDYDDYHYDRYSRFDDDPENEVPDYSKFLELAEKALQLGLADELLTVLDMILDSVSENNEDCTDQLYEAAEPLYPVMIKALEDSSLAEDKKIVLAADRILSMPWGSAGQLKVFLEAGHFPENWSKAADEFLARVSKTSADRTGACRDEICDFAVEALERAGRTAEIIPLLTKEAGLTNSYERLVKRLAGAGMADEALKQAEKGILAGGQGRERRDRELRLMRAGIWTEKQEWLPVLGYYICNTADSTSSSSPDEDLYGPIKEAAQHLKRWPEVRTSFLEFLETGTLPWVQKGTAWIKPDQAELKERRFGNLNFPQFAALIRIFVKENKPAEVLKWYDRLLEARAKSNSWVFSRPFFEDKIDLQVAKAVKDSAPDRTLDIWVKAAESSIAETKPDGYQRAGHHLENIRDLMIKLKKEKQWQEYLAGLRSVHIRKRLLMPLLDKL
jgi:uncharacterized Zn finger protein